MKSYNKKLNKSGSLTLPAVIRREYGLSDGEKFNIVVNGQDGTIMLQRTQGSCMFCHNDQQLIVFHGRFICAPCVQHMDATVTEQREANAFEGRNGQ
ncbi:hypothetical protein J6TS7_21650 [Paenibacillus dendritiformis]|uniref:AbrB/MazE/SpoVT family DNA-binding domain-containing protein n=1 Tax=Paenibacillus TaxID=44249 RepID=UPI001B0C0304|nr:AbrB/MazE/SpoVT family DNA-binding domain-containing protein [Paenibacillus dendritiformis]GIO78555.1 hypothetical protein J6TS7_21650 [Paenibacillus dendritiformis]